MRPSGPCDSSPFSSGKTASRSPRTTSCTSFQRIVDPKNPLDGASALGGLKPSGITKVDDLTTKFTWDAPNVLFGTDGLNSGSSTLFPRASTPRSRSVRVPGSSTDFRPGEQSVLEKNTNWHGEEP